MAVLNKKKKKVKPTKMPIPQTLADSIPYTQVYSNGIFELEPHLYSKSYHISDVNFKTATAKKQEDIAELYGTFLGSFEPDVTVQVTLYNKTISLQDFQQQVMIDMKNDNLNIYREEYNSMLLDKMTGAKNNIEVEKILSISLPAIDIIEATNKFKQIDDMVTDHMAKITKVDAIPYTTMERLELLNSIYNQDKAVPLYRKRTIAGHEVESFTLENCAAQGITTKDAIVPPGFAFKDMNFKFGNTIGKTYYIVNYPTWVRGDLMTSLANIPCNMLVSSYFNTIAHDKAVALLKRQGTNINSDIADVQKRAAKSRISADLISPQLQDSKKETKDLMDAVTKENARLFVANTLITLFASSEEELDGFEEQLELIANSNLITIQPLQYEQEIGFDSSLPLAHNMVKLERLMQTESVSCIIPFAVKEIKQPTGLYYGLNASSRNMILYDRTTDLNPNGCILGMPGSGKSFAAKREMVNILLNTEDEVYVIDPEREYVELAKHLGGAVIKIKNGSSVYLNPMDLNLDNVDDDGDPIKVKTDFMSTLCEIIAGGRYGLSPGKKSIIDRCTKQVYDPYIQYLRTTGKKIDIDKCPTLLDFYEVLSMQPQVEAQDLALAMERYVTGALDIFAHKTNVEIGNRFTVYDIKEIGSGLMELGLHICLDNIWNKMISNAEHHKRTWIYIDEFHLMMQKPTSADYISQIWKRARKWNGIPTAITQNVEDMLKSSEARTIINNCSFVMMLTQSPMNKAQLSELYDLSLEEQRYISTSKTGMGLIKIVDNIIPMDDSFPTDTQLYHIMSTKPDERIAS